MVLMLVVLLIVWNPNFISHKVRNVFFVVTYPAQRILTISAEKIGGFGEMISSVGNLKKENERLLLENVKLQAEVAKLRDVAGENEYLRKELELSPRDKFNLITSRVVGKDLYGNNWILIDKGKKDGIETGMPVVAEGGVLVGKVAEVFAYNAKVFLITNPQSKINAVTSETGAIGIVKSMYGLGMVLDMVLQTDYLKVGDTVITSDLGKKMPRGLLIGKIEEIQTSDDRLFQRAVLSLPVDLSKLHFVSVIKN